MQNVQYNEHLQQAPNSMSSILRAMQGHPQRSQFDRLIVDESFGFARLNKPGY
jgi:hypothetical protein